MKTLDLEPAAWRIAHAGHSVDEAFMAFDDLVKRRVPFDAACWTTLDPATGLFTASTSTGMPKDRDTDTRMHALEFGEGEPSSMRSLMQRGEPTAILSQVTHGDLTRASRYELYAAFGLTDELRALLCVDGIVWGAAVLLRAGGRFDASDARAVQSIGKHAADAVRLALLRGAAARPEAVADPPGVFTVTPDGVVAALTAPAQRWSARAGPALTYVVQTAAAAIRQRPRTAGARSRLVTDDGHVLSVHASAMARDSDAVAVIVDKARPAEVSSLLVDAYGLTPRQRDVLGRILLGRSMTQIAHTLEISENTAQDHRKAIYRRIGVTSRSELAALLQYEQYDPKMWDEIPPSPYGGFLE